MNRTWKHLAAFSFFAGVAGVGVLAACSDDSGGAGRLNGYGSSGSAGSNPGDGGGTTAEGGSQQAQMARAEAAYRKLEPDMMKTCGSGTICHQTDTNPSKFLAPPDTYKSIKATPGIVVRDVFTSKLITKGAHAGPALSANPTFETAVTDWLNLEAIVLQGAKLPTTDAVVVAMGANTIDLTKAGPPEVAGAKLSFDAALVGTILQITNIKVTAPATSPVHLVHPFFFRVKQNPAKTELPEVPDPSDTFSNSDQTYPAGVATTMAPGTALFTGDDWKWAQGDKIRIEFTKIEKGVAATDAGGPSCKDVAGFTANVKPVLVAQGCSGNCHGNNVGGSFDLRGIAGANNNNAEACLNVLQRIDQTTFNNSLILRKMSGAVAHAGGQNANVATAITNNKAVFY